MLLQQPRAAPRRRRLGACQLLLSDQEQNSRAKQVVIPRYRAGLDPKLSNPILVIVDLSKVARLCTAFSNTVFQLDSN